MADNLLEYILQLWPIGHVGRFVQALTTFNYQVVKTLMQLVSEGVKAVVIVALAVGRACADICHYVVDFGIESIRFLQVFFQAVSNIGHNILSLIYQGFEYIGIWLADGCLWCLRFVYHGCVSFADFTGISSLSIPLLTDSICSAFQKVWWTICVSITWTKTTCISCVVKICSTVVVLCQAGYHTVADVCYALLSGVCQVVTALTVSVSELFTVAAVSVAKISSSLWHSISTQFIDVKQRFQKHVPLGEDIVFILLYLTFLLVGLRLIVQFLCKRGLTFPCFQPSTIDIPLEQYGNDAIELSEGEDEEEEGAEEDEEIVPTESSTEDEGDEESDEMEEFEVAETESEEEISAESNSDDENNQNLINVQLPPTAGGYGLRSRISPSPCPSVSKLSPGELEQRLELERDRRMCVVCQDQVKNVLVLPCRHMCLCVVCAHEIAKSRLRNRRICPLCRGPIETVMNVYI